MTGIVIFTASRDDAFKDYQRCVEEGVDVQDIDDYLSNDVIQMVRGEDDRVRLWGTTVENQWKKIDRNDIVLVYRNGRFVSRARAIRTQENLELAAHLWKYEDNPWEDDNPWKYLVFVDQFEQIDVPLDDFNSLVGYADEYIPQGFLRVADKRINDLLEHYDSVENAVAELTGTGEKVHQIDTEEDEEQCWLNDLSTNLREAGTDGDRSEEFERLVGDAFSRLGFDAQWIQGGRDTDVEITNPVHIVVEAKSRGSSHGIRNINAAGIVKHRDQREADHALVVGRHFPDQAIMDARNNGITTLTIGNLIELLKLHDRYALTPERIAELLSDPGAFQETQLDTLREEIDERKKAMDATLSILRGLERREAPVTANQLYFILLGMSASKGEVPSEDSIEHTLKFLSHPTFQLLSVNEDGYTLATEFDNAAKVISSISTLLEESMERIEGASEQ